ncbi:MAG: MarR family winged helix-turn-helix transcriptional regulator [Rhodospirillales bacterium]
MTIKPNDRADRAVLQWSALFPDWDLRPMELLGRLGETAAVISRDHQAPLFARHGLQPGEFDVLAALRRSGEPFEMTPTRLFEITMMSSGGMTARLDRMERMGLIHRRPNPDDRRGVLVGLSDRGLALIDLAVPEHLANQARLTGCLSETELVTLSRLLGKLLTHAENC